MLLSEELALVERAKTGDQKALSDLWDDITPKLYGYLLNTLRESRLAEDILQDTWLKAIGSISKFRPQGVRFSAWLFAIAKNECRQHWRKNGREVPLEEVPETVISNTSTTDTIFLEKMLKQLSEHEQEILRLRYIADLSFKEIARVLSISIISARVRAHRALGKAHAILKHY